MGMLDTEIEEIHSELGKIGITKARCLLTIKSGWINFSIDGESVFEFNKKKNFVLNDRGQQVEEIQYKYKDKGKVVKSLDWKEVKTIFLNRAKATQ